MILPEDCLFLSDDAVSQLDWFDFLRGLASTPKTDPQRTRKLNFLFGLSSSRWGADVLYPHEIAQWKLDGMHGFEKRERLVCYRCCGLIEYANEDVKTRVTKKSDGMEILKIVDRWVVCPHCDGFNDI